MLFQILSLLNLVFLIKDYVLRIKIYINIPIICDNNQIGYVIIDQSHKAIESTSQSNNLSNCHS